MTITIHSGQAGTPAPTAAEYTESTNWSGYVVPSTQSVIDATSGTWTVPTLNCTDTPNASVSEWVGIGGVHWPGGGNSGALLQTGTEDRCVGGAQEDDAWWELYPSNPNASITFTNLDVSPGDEMQASVRKTTGGHWTTKIDDVTKGLAGVMLTGAGWGTAGDGSGSSTFSKAGTTAQLAYAGGYSAEWIVEDSGTTLTQLAPFANFGAVTFSDLATSLPTWALTPAEGVELVQNGVTLATPDTPNSGEFDVRYTGP
ncbi:MAG: G1 family glutamic endopeptidase [Acidimicrobiales bacterium]